MRICSKVFFFLILFSPSVWAFDLEGKVKVEPPIPEARLLEVPEEHVASCGQSKLSPKLKISSEGGLANAVVKLEGAFPDSKNLPREGNFVLNQLQCEFVPHVLLIPDFETLLVLNSDGFLHNVRAFDENARMLFNDAMPKKGQVLKKRLKAPGRYILRCGVHPWMHALVIAQEHPYYALTDETGHFKIEGVPEGHYRLTVWHESLGEIKVRVNPNTPPLNLVYRAPPQETR